MNKETFIVYLSVLFNIAAFSFVYSLFDNGFRHYFFIAFIPVVLGLLSYFYFIRMGFENFRAFKYANLVCLLSYVLPVGILVIYLRVGESVTTLSGDMVVDPYLRECEMNCSMLYDNLTEKLNACIDSCYD